MKMNPIGDISNTQINKTDVDMKNHTPILIFSLIFGFFAGSAAATDMDQLQGSWQLVLQEREGELQDIKAIIITFAGKEFKTYKDGELIETGTITLDESASPRHYDAVSSGKNKGSVYPAIYRLKGDTWQTSVTTTADGSRPAAFLSKAGSGNQILVWRRIGTLASEAPAG